MDPLPSLRYRHLSAYAPKQISNVPVQVMDVSQKQCLCTSSSLDPKIQTQAVASRL